ncbi:MAG: 6,7-dimethyl-8-ribityllumazine synthase [Chitinophagaceae bacterium]
MASKGNQQLLTAGIAGLPEDAVVVIVKTEWNAVIIDKLETGCKKVLKANGVKSTTLLVPGAVEIPFAINAYAQSPRKADAFVALACVIRGDTPHFEYVCQSITQGITTLNTQLDVPVIYGVLTVNEEQQAIERIGGKHGHKGEEAGLTAIKMIILKRRIASGKL